MRFGKFNGKKKAEKVSFLFHVTSEKIVDFYKYNTLSVFARTTALFVSSEFSERK